jgi:hypothetical protein
MAKLLSVILVVIQGCGILAYLFCKLASFRRHRNDPAKRDGLSWATPKWLVRFVFDQDLEANAAKARLSNELHPGS